jgi:hypothetical protein
VWNTFDWTYSKISGGIAMSFHEKSAWACLSSIMLVFAPYHWVVFQYPIAFIGLFPLAVIVLCILLTAFHLVNALATHSIRETGDTPSLDELDRLIEMRAAKLSGIVLSVAVMVWCLFAMFVIPAIGVRELTPTPMPAAVPAATQFLIPVSQALLAIHLLFAGFVIANIAYYGSIIAGYRRLAHG